MIDPLYSFSGFVVGLLVGMTGVGGGALMTPLLIFANRVPERALQVVLAITLFVVASRIGYDHAARGALRQRIGPFSCKMASAFLW